jgi:hypothetical protein
MPKYGAPCRARTVSGQNSRASTPKLRAGHPLLKRYARGEVTEEYVDPGDSHEEFSPGRPAGASFAALAACNDAPNSRRAGAVRAGEGRARTKCTARARRLSVGGGSLLTRVFDPRSSSTLSVLLCLAFGRKPSQHNFAALRLAKHLPPSTEGGRTSSNARRRGSNAYSERLRIAPANRPRFNCPARRRTVAPNGRRGRVSSAGRTAGPNGVRCVGETAFRWQRRPGASSSAFLHHSSGFKVPQVFFVFVAHVFQDLGIQQ